MGEERTSQCPGCGVRLPERDVLLDRQLGASPECWHRCGEAVGFEYTDLTLMRRCHQLTVDAYGAQHPDPPTPPIRVYYSLVGLHLALDRGLAGTAVRDAHRRMGRPAGWWPRLQPPPFRGALTADDLARAGSDATSVDGHAAVARRWAAAVWNAWAPQHAEIAELTRRLLGEIRVGPR